MLSACSSQWERKIEMWVWHIQILQTNRLRVLVKIAQMSEAALSRFFEVHNRCEKSHAMIRTDSMYKQCGWTNTQDKDITVYFPRRKRLMLHINIWTLHNYQLVHFVYSLHTFTCLCGIGKESKVVLSMCVIYLSNRISVQSLLKQMWWTKYQI